MTQEPAEILSLFKKSEELVEMLREGRVFTEELMRENERLRYRIVQLEAQNMKSSAAVVEELEGLRLENSQMSQELQFLEQRFSRVEAENKDFAQRYVEVEEQNESLANLYVASHRLHSTLDSTEVVECIKEILLNMVGSEDFGLFVFDDETNELVRAGHEGETAARAEKARIMSGEGIEGGVATHGESFFGDHASEEACACVPLKIKDRVIGVITIYALLPHKKELTQLDHKLLELLAGHAASALISSKLYGMADRKLRTMEGFMSLLRMTQGGANV
ncbi:MAG TPA: GAF domain-containing protein [Blastocatellia bacterium]|jgi:nitrate/nitrite-specific signal transduction histidine kinase